MRLLPILPRRMYREVRDSLLDSPVIDLDPTRSRFLTKGAHSPALTAQQAAAIVQWLERDQW